MKSSFPFLTPALGVVAVLAFSTPTTSAGWKLDFDLSLGATILSGGAENTASKLIDSTQERSKRNRSKKKRKGGIRYKKPNYKIKAPEKSEADRLKEKEGGLEYLKGKGLSPTSPLARKSPNKK